MPLPASYSWFVVSPSSGGIPGGGIRGVAGGRWTGEGKNGIAVPFSSDGRGRLALVSGDEQLRKIIICGLMDCENENPFNQDIGLGSQMIFAQNIDSLQADLRRRINALFRRLQLADRARLASPVKFTVNSAEQELECDVHYLNIEENKSSDLSIGFVRSAAGGASQALVNALAR